MAKKGLVASIGDPRSKKYSITDAGKLTLRNILSGSISRKEAFKKKG